MPPRFSLSGTSIPEESKSRTGPQVGRTGLKHFSGFINEEFLPELRGPLGVRTYEEMRKNEPNIAGMLMAIEYVIAGVGWEAAPVSQTPEDIAAADFINNAFEELETPLEEHVLDALTMLPFGWSLFEIVYKMKEGKIYWDKWAFRSQDSLFRWKFSEDHRKLLSFCQRPAPTYEELEIPLEKCLHYRTRNEKDNPEGLSLLRSAYKPYYFKRVIEEVEAMGAERDLIGIPVMEVPFGATSEEVEVSKQIVEAVKNDDQSGIVLTAIGPEPHQRFNFKVVSGQGSSGKVSYTDRLVQRYSNEITMVCLAQFLRLGQGASGSYSLSSDQKDMFQVAVRGIMTRVRNTIMNQGVKKLLRLNGMTGKVKLEHGRVGQLSLQTMSNFLAAGVQNQFITANRELENFLRKEAELPLLSDGEETAGEKADKAASAAPVGAPEAAGGPGEGGETQGVNSMPGENQSGAFGPGGGNAEIKEPVPFSASKVLSEVFDQFDEEFLGNLFSFEEPQQFHVQGQHHQKRHSGKVPTELQPPELTDSDYKKLAGPGDYTSEESRQMATPFDTVAVAKVRQYQMDWISPVTGNNSTTMIINGQHVLETKSEVTYNGVKMRRGEMHKKILDEVYEEGAQMAGTVKQGRRVDIVIGPPAAGKSSVAVDALAKQHGGRIVDADLVKARLPEFRNGLNANGVHEESALLASAIFQRSMKSGDNMVLQILGSSDEQVKRKYITQLKAAGYDVHLTVVTADRDVVTKRAIKRFTDGETFNKKKVHRFVDPSIAYHLIGNRPLETFKKLAKSGLATSVAGWITNTFPAVPLDISTALA